MAFAVGIAVVLLTAFSDWLDIHADQQPLSMLVALPVVAVMRVLSATRLALGLVAVGALGALGARLVLGI